MLKTNSNIQEVYEFLTKNKGEMSSHNIKELAQWKKLIRQTKGQASSMLYEFKVGGNTCYSVRYVDGDTTCYSNIIVVPFANDKYQYIHWMTTFMNAFKYTSHFFDRYKERMNIKGSMKQAVKQYFKRARTMACIYRKNGQVVYTTEDGLVLGVENEDLGMRVGCTFVDYSLLKHSQRAAFEKIQEVADAVRNKHVDLTDVGLSHQDATDVVSEEYHEARQAAEEIYSWYFEEGDLKLRD